MSPRAVSVWRHEAPNDSGETLWSTKMRSSAVTPSVLGHSIVSSSSRTFVPDRSALTGYTGRQGAGAETTVPAAATGTPGHTARSRELARQESAFLLVRNPNGSHPAPARNKPAGSCRP